MRSLPFLEKARQTHADSAGFVLTSDYFGYLIMRYLAPVLISFLLASPVFAEDGEPSSEQEYAAHGRNHLSMILADTNVSGEGDNFTVGLDYEYRLNELIGLGAVIERAYGELDATTLLAVADIHFQSGLIMQVGPGFEHRDDENVFVTRVGVLYEFELEHYTLSPQLHWDYHEGESNAIVAGVAFGFSF